MESTPDVEYLLSQVYGGNAAKFPAGTLLDVQTVRAYMLELNADAHPGGRHRSCLRWEIHGAVFSERLDLKDGRRADGGPVPAIEFHGCEFREGFCADGAHLDRLVFRACKFTSRQQDQNHISLRNCRISTELQLKDLYPVDLQGPPLSNEISWFQGPFRGLLWVDAFATYIGTNVMVHHCLLRAPAEQSDLTLPEPRYALDLSTAEIKCDLRLQPSVTLEGGLKMRDVRIGGSLFGQGLTVTDGEDEATRQTIVGTSGEPRSGVNAQSAEIHGNVLFSVDRNRIKEYLTNSIDPVRFWCEGKIRFYGLRLGGAFDLSGAHIGGTKFANVELYAARIGGDLLAYAVTLPSVQNRYSEFPRLLLKIVPAKEQVVPNLVLANCYISGDCNLYLETSALEASGATVQGNFSLSGNLHRFSAGGLQVGRDTTLRLAQSDLTTNIDELEECNLGGAILKGKLEMIDMSCHVKSLSLRDAEIGHALFVAPLYTRFSRIRRRPLRCYPDFTLTEIEIPEDVEAGSRSAVATFLTSKKHKPVTLDGRSVPIHQLNKEIGFRLTSEEMAQDYLRLFCAYVWGEQGSFTLVENPSKLPKAFRGKIALHPVHRSKGKEHDPENLYYFDAFVRYAHLLFHATFKIDSKAGSVDMLADEPFITNNKYVLYQWNELPEFRSPFRTADNWDDPEFTSDCAWVEGDVARSELREEAPKWSELLTSYQLRGANIDLREARCGMLKDNSGRAWAAAAAVMLDEFKYRETFLPHSAPGYGVDDEVEYRKKMLSGGTDFRAQPYAHLAKVMRDRGDDDAARKIEAESIRLGAEDRAKRKHGAKFLLHFWWRPYGFFFQYGLGVIPALWTLTGFLFFGWLAITMLSQNGYLNASVSTVAAAAIQQGATPTTDPVVKAIVPTSSGTYIEAIPCGKAIAPVLYAAELMTPILNFHQASRCEIREYKSGDETRPLKLWGHAFWHPRFVAYPRIWEYLKGAYILLGSLITSLALLTFSGIARRWEH